MSHPNDPVIDEEEEEEEEDRQSRQPANPRAGMAVAAADGQISGLFSSVRSVVCFEIGFGVRRSQKIHSGRSTAALAQDYARAARAAKVATR